MGVVKTGDYRMTFKIDNLRPFRGKTHDPIVTTGGEDFTVSDRHRIGRDFDDREYEPDRESGSVWQFAT